MMRLVKAENWSLEPMLLRKLSYIVPQNHLDDIIVQNGSDSNEPIQYIKAV